MLRKFPFNRVKCQTIEVSYLTKLNYNSPLVKKERYLRKKAYELSDMKTSAVFYDDSDMKTNYFLTVLYDSQTGIPLLSVRHYYNKKIIQEKLNGGNLTEMKNNSNIDKTNLTNYEDGKIFLADRLSANTSNQFFIKHRPLIFLKYYSNLYKKNKGNKYFLMVRSEKFEKLLTKYLRLGLLIVGSTKHHNLKHWILLGDFADSIKILRRQLVLYILLTPTYYFKPIN